MSVPEAGGAEWLKALLLYGGKMGGGDRQEDGGGGSEGAGKWRRSDRYGGGAGL